MLHVSCKDKETNDTVHLVCDVVVVPNVSVLRS